MTFSAEVKKELSGLPLVSEAEARAELSGLVGAGARIQMAGETPVLQLKSENPAVAGRIYKLIKYLYGIKPLKSVTVQHNFKTHREYRIGLGEQVETALKDLRILNKKSDGEPVIRSDIPRRFLAKQAMVRAYIRGVFLICGYLANPEKNLHLELVSRQEAYLREVAEVLDGYEIRCNVLPRKKNFILYIKEGESIASFLNIIGAHRALLELENIRIVKGMRAGVNRQVNCETANVGKTVSAAGQQRRAIEKLAASGVLEDLDPGLRALAELRLAYPEMSLKELGEKLTPPVGKSGVYHRMKKLLDLAEDN